MTVDIINMMPIPLYLIILQQGWWKLDFIFTAIIVKHKQPPPNGEQNKQFFLLKCEVTITAQFYTQNVGVTIEKNPLVEPFVSPVFKE